MLFAMTSAPRIAPPAIDLEPEPKPADLTPAERGAKVLGRALEPGHGDGAGGWGGCPQGVLARVLADLIAASEEDGDLSFADALAEAWRIDSFAGADPGAPLGGPGRFLGADTIPPCPSPAGSSRSCS